jgi:anti-sigma B factor antagonist
MHGNSEHPNGGSFAADVDMRAAAMELRGELDVCTAPLLREAARLLLARSPRTAIISLAGLDFIDAAGIGTLLQLKKELDERGGRLVLANPQRRVARAFELVGLGGLLDRSLSRAG